MLFRSRVVVADAAYGVSGPFRRELEARGLYYVVGISEQMIVFTEEPRWEWPDPAVRGRSAPRSRPRLARGAPEPVTLAELAARTSLRRVTWRQRDQRAVKRPVCLAAGHSRPMAGRPASAPGPSLTGS